MVKPYICKVGVKEEEDRSERDRQVGKEGAERVT